MSRKPKPKLPVGWDVYVNKRKPLTRRGTPPWKYIVWAVLIVILAGVAYYPWKVEGATGGGPSPAYPADTVRATFSLCHTGGGTNCVVDGDTIWMDGVKIRIADIDAPETHPSRCPREAELGTQATRRLQQLVNVGGVTAERHGRDQDRYGRKLRVLTVGGRSIGAMLVSEGLARPWDGKRHPWC